MNLDNYTKFLIEFNRKGEAQQMAIIGNILIYAVLALLLLATILLVVMLVSKLIKWIKRKKKSQ